jgi:hypothetical protein
MVSDLTQGDDLKKIRATSDLTQGNRVKKDKRG